MTYRVGPPCEMLGEVKRGSLGIRGRWMVAPTWDQAGGEVEEALVRVGERGLALGEVQGEAGAVREAGEVAGEAGGEAAGVGMMMATGEAGQGGAGTGEGEPRGMKMMKGAIGLRTSSGASWIR